MLELGGLKFVLFSFQSFKNIKDYIDYAKGSQDLSIVAGGKCDDRYTFKLIFKLNNAQIYQRMFLLNNIHSYTAKKRPKNFQTFVPNYFLKTVMLIGFFYWYTFKLTCVLNKSTLLCCSSVGYFIEPTIIETKKPDDKLMNEVNMRVIIDFHESNYFLLYFDVHILNFIPT